MRGNSLKNTIYSLINMHPNGLTAYQLQDMTNCAVCLVRRCLYEMIKCGLVEAKRIERMIYYKISKKEVLDEYNNKNKVSKLPPEKRNGKDQYDIILNAIKDSKNGLSLKQCSSLVDMSEVKIERFLRDLVLKEKVIKSRTKPILYSFVVDIKKSSLTKGCLPIKDDLSNTNLDDLIYLKKEKMNFYDKLCLFVFCFGFCILAFGFAKSLICKNDYLFLNYDYNHLNNFLIWSIIILALIWILCAGVKTIIWEISYLFVRIYEKNKLYDDRLNYSIYRLIQNACFLYKICTIVREVVFAVISFILFVATILSASHLYFVLTSSLASLILFSISLTSSIKKIVQSKRFYSDFISKERIDDFLMNRIKMYQNQNPIDLLCDGIKSEMDKKKKAKIYKKGVFSIASSFYTPLY